MGERKGEPPDAHAVGDLGSATGEVEFRALAGSAPDLKLAPVDAAADAGTKCLGSCLLGSEAGGEALGVVLLGQAVCDLAGGVDAMEERLTEALVAVLDACDLDEVCAEAEDQGELLVERSGLEASKVTAC